MIWFGTIRDLQCARTFALLQCLKHTRMNGSPMIDTRGIDASVILRIEQGNQNKGKARNKHKLTQNRAKSKQNDENKRIITTHLAEDAPVDFAQAGLWWRPTVDHTAGCCRLRWCPVRTVGVETQVEQDNEAKEEKQAWAWKSLDLLRMVRETLASRHPNLHVWACSSPSHLS